MDCPLYRLFQDEEKEEGDAACHVRARLYLRLNRGVAKDAQELCERLTRAGGCGARRALAPVPLQRRDMRLVEWRCHRAFLEKVASAAPAVALCEDADAALAEEGDEEPDLSRPEVRRLLHDFPPEALLPDFVCNPDAALRLPELLRFDFAQWWRELAAAGEERAWRPVQQSLMEERCFLLRRLRRDALSAAAAAYARFLREEAERCGDWPARAEEGEEPLEDEERWASPYPEDRMDAARAKQERRRRGGGPKGSASALPVRSWLDAASLWREGTCVAAADDFCAYWQRESLRPVLGGEVPPCADVRPMPPHLMEPAEREGVLLIALADVVDAGEFAPQGPHAVAWTRAPVVRLDPQAAAARGASVTLSYRRAQFQRLLGLSDDDVAARAPWAERAWAAFVAHPEWLANLQREAREGPGRLRGGYADNQALAVAAALRALNVERSVDARAFVRPSAATAFPRERAVLARFTDYPDLARSPLVSPPTVAKILARVLARWCGARVQETRAKSTAAEFAVANYWFGPEVYERLRTSDR